METPLPQEKHLLLPFESERFPEPYKEYYKTKRNNFFASIQGFPDLWTYYVLLDRIWFREINDLAAPGDPKKLFLLMLYINAHAKVRVSVELAFTGCLSEARSILRDAIEFVAHAHSMLRDPTLQRVWLNKYEEEQAFKDAFERQKKDGIFKDLEELHRTWGELSESGSHANLHAICDRFVVQQRSDGGHDWRLNYCGVDPAVWEISLFPMLLSCFTMENTFFGDYQSRLNLDHVLVEMRTHFERQKESVRERMKMKVRHHKAEGPVGC